jgi:hypothetical protein
MTHEYLRAVEDIGLPYGELKRMARESLEHSFIPGDSLWSDGRELRRTAVCAGDQTSEKCEKFIRENQRARVQWELEKAFGEFEKKF